MPLDHSLLNESLPGSVYGAPRVWLRLEGVSAFAAAVAAYAVSGQSWVLFALLFFLPDAIFLGYLAGPRVGAFCYNLLHNYAVPIAGGVTLYLLGRSVAAPLIWVAHIGFDRALGYGLKYPGGFGQTHLGLLGGGKQSMGAALQ